MPNFEAVFTSAKVRAAGGRRRTKASASVAPTSSLPTHERRRGNGGTLRERPADARADGLTLFRSGRRNARMLRTGWTAQLNLGYKLFQEVGALPPVRQGGCSRAANGNARIRILLGPPELEGEEAGKFK